MRTFPPSFFVAPNRDLPTLVLCALAVASGYWDAQAPLEI